ncbi:hypothetical protein ES703_121038 [subsurface metagenome]
MTSGTTGLASGVTGFSITVGTSSGATSGVISGFSTTSISGVTAGGVTSGCGGIPSPGGASRPNIAFVTLNTTPGTENIVISVSNCFGVGSWYFSIPRAARPTSPIRSSIISASIPFHPVLRTSFIKSFARAVGFAFRNERSIPVFIARLFI